MYIPSFLTDVGETVAILPQGYPVAPENGITALEKYRYLFYDEAKFQVGFDAGVTKKESDFMDASQVPIVAS